MSKLNRTYQAFLGKYPVFSQALQTSILLGAGDIIAQNFVEKKKYNPSRTIRFACLGIFLVGPAVYNWYRLLQWGFGDGTMIIALKKLACDQLIFAPCFTPIFLAALSFLHGYDIDETIGYVKRDYFDIMESNYKVWPGVILFNFYLMPLRYQLLVMQTVGLFWNTYVSWKTHQ